MENHATEAILKHVRDSRFRAENALLEYKHGSDRIKRRMRREIDLLSTSAKAEIRHLYNEVRRNSEKLFSALQSEVQILDSACRPLLDQSPSLQAVREVCDLIKMLNEESEITNNFSGTVNDRNVGRLASIEYAPLVENLTIQRFWETKYDSMPGRAEQLVLERELRLQAQERERARQEQERLRLEQKKAEAAEAERRKMEAEEAERKRSIERVESNRKKMSARFSRMNEKLSDVERNVPKEIIRDRKKLSDLQSERNQLGFLQFKEKKALSEQIAQVESQLRSSEDAYGKKLADIRNQADKMRCAVELIGGKIGDECSFGVQFYDRSTPMKWVVVSNDGKQIILMAKHTVEALPYAQAFRWMNEEFLTGVFTEEERRVLLAFERGYITKKVFPPLESEVNSVRSALEFSPELSLIRHIREERTEWGRKNHKAQLDIDNSIANNIDATRPYWLFSGHSGSCGSANFISAYPNRLKGEKIDADALLGVRPVICIHVQKLLDSL